MSNLTPEEDKVIDILMVTALFRCFHEHLYTIKGSHSQVLKMKFNRLVKVGRQYEAEIHKHYGEDSNIEAIYDELMELMFTIRQSIEKSVEDGKQEVS